MRTKKILLLLMVAALLSSASCGPSEDGANESGADRAGANESGGAGANESGADGAGANGGGANGAGANGGGALVQQDTPDQAKSDGGAPKSDGGADSGASSDDPNARAWLSEHNARRQKYHAKYGGSYVPLKWSAALAASATKYAEYMAKNDVWAHSDSDYGENLAWNGGSKPAEISNVMTRWVEGEEATWGGHMTQVLWRATKYVGCGMASSQHGNFQVCQYVTPGNCGDRKKETMMADTTRCLPACPPEGCF